MRCQKGRRSILLVVVKRRRGGRSQDFHFMQIGSRRRCATRIGRTQIQRGRQRSDGVGRKRQRMSAGVKLLLVVSHQRSQRVRRLMHQNVAQHLIETGAVATDVGQGLRRQIAGHHLRCKCRRPCVGGGGGGGVCAGRRRRRPHHRDRVHGRRLDGGRLRCRRPVVGSWRCGRRVVVVGRGHGRVDEPRDGKGKMRRRLVVDGVPARTRRAPTPGAALFLLDRTGQWRRTVSARVDRVRQFVLVIGQTDWAASATAVVCTRFAVSHFCSALLCQQQLKERQNALVNVGMSIESSFGQPMRLSSGCTSR